MVGMWWTVHPWWVGQVLGWWLVLADLKYLRCWGQRVQVDVLSLGGVLLFTVGLMGVKVK